MIAHVFKRRWRKDGKLHVAEHYSAKLQMSWESKVQVISLQTTDKRIAQDYLNQLVKERHQERQGLLPARTVRDAAARPIAEVLALFLGDLRAKGRAATTLKKYESILPLICERCGWDKLPDVTARSFCEWRVRSGLGPKTLNDYLGAASGFIHWLQRQGMMRDNPLVMVDRVDTRCINPCRRALSPDEVKQLLKVSPHFRAVVYLVALNTGLRRNELNGLRWCSFVLDTPQPFVRVAASMSKNKKETCLLLRPEVVAGLRSIKEAKAKPMDYVFRHQVPRVSTLVRDLAAAGIPEVDEQGRRVDFHALRHTFGTNLSASGAHPRVAMEMMRHSDLKLTMKNYTDVAQLPVAQALAALPSFALPVVAEDTQKRTQITPICTLNGVSCSPVASSPDTVGHTGINLKSG